MTASGQSLPRAPTNQPWIVFDYEVMMYLGTRLAPRSPSLPLVVHNALVESRLLHTRITVDLLISKGSQPDDIGLAELMPDWMEDESLVEAIASLRTAYGSASSEGTPCWTLNKKMVHSTKWRTDSHNYSPALSILDPLVVSALERIEELVPYGLAQLRKGFPLEAPYPGRPTTGGTSERTKPKAQNPAAR
jgi:hypothetical protein